MSGIKDNIKNASREEKVVGILKGFKNVGKKVKNKGKNILMNMKKTLSENAPEGNICYSQFSRTYLGNIKVDTTIVRHVEENKNSRN